MSTQSVVDNSELRPSPSSSAAKPQRYHPALVALHWLIAILIFGAFFLAQGNEGERERFRSSRQDSGRKRPARTLIQEPRHRAFPGREAKVPFQRSAFI